MSKFEDKTTNKKSISNSITEYAIGQIMQKFCSTTSFVSDETMLKGFDLLQKTSIGSTSDTLRVLRQAFENNHPLKQVIHKTLKNVHPNSKKHLMKNFAIKNIVNDVIPRNTILEPIKRCNLACNGCYASTYTQEDDMDPKLLAAQIGKNIRNGVQIIILAGGEPFLYPHIWDILASHRDVLFIVFTNGTLITKQMAKILRKFSNVIPAISLEGLPLQTDSRRGNGVFQSVMRAMDYLRKERVMFFYAATATKVNAQTIVSNAFVDLMIEKGALAGWVFTYLPISGEMDPSLSADQMQKEHIWQKINRIRDKKPILLIDFFADNFATNDTITSGDVAAA